MAVGAGALTVVFDVCYLSVLPGLVGREQIQQVNGGLEASRAAAIAGPGLGGALVSLLRASGAVIVDAASFLVSAACLLTIRKPEPAPEPPSGPRGLRALLAGWHQVARSPLLRPNTIYMLTTAVPLFSAVRHVQRTPEPEPAWG